LAGVAAVMLAQLTGNCDGRKMTAAEFAGMLNGHQTSAAILIPDYRRLITAACQGRGGGIGTVTTTGPDILASPTAATTEGGGGGSRTSQWHRR